MPDRKANKRSSREPHQLAQLKTDDHPPTRSLPAAVRLVTITSIRTDGDTQHRIAPNPKIVQEYSELMRAGVVFPPIDARWDGTDYWLSDGFQRIDAAKFADRAEILASIRPGTREDAQWDSYAANATHGLRRRAAETEKVMQLALLHQNAVKMSNVQIAKHLYIPESTVRYWRKRLSLQHCEDSVLATRGGTTYPLATRNLGKRTGENGGRAKPQRDLRADLNAVKEKSSPPVRLLLNIIEHWLLSPKCGSSEFLDSLDRYLWAHRTEFVEPRARPPQSSAAAPVEKGLLANDGSGRPNGCE